MGKEQICTMHVLSLSVLHSHRTLVPPQPCPFFKSSISSSMHGEPVAAAAAAAADACAAAAARDEEKQQDCAGKTASTNSSNGGHGALKLVKAYSLIRYTTPGVTHFFLMHNSSGVCVFRCVGCMRNMHPHVPTRPPALAHPIALWCVFVFMHLFWPSALV